MGNFTHRVVGFCITKMGFLPRYWEIHKGFGIFLHHKYLDQWVVGSIGQWDIGMVLFFSAFFSVFRFTACPRHDHLTTISQHFRPPFLIMFAAYFHHVSRHFSSLSPFLSIFSAFSHLAGCFFPLVPSTVRNSSNLQRIYGQTGDSRWIFLGIAGLFAIGQAVGIFCFMMVIVIRGCENVTCCVNHITIDHIIVTNVSY